MNEDERRVRRALRAGEESGPAPESAWPGIQEQASRRGRLHRRIRRASWLAPLVILVAGVPAYEALAPAGGHPLIIVISPSPKPSVAVTPAPGSTPAAAQIPVAACQITDGLAPARPIVPPSTTTVSGGITPGIAAYGGTMVLLGPTGWSCQATAFADGGLQQVLHPPGETLPTGNLNQSTTMTAQAIVGYLPAPRDGPAKSLACPYTAAARSDAQAAGLACTGPPAGESVTQLDANDVLVDDPSHVAGGGALSGGPNPAESLVFYNPTTQGAGMVTCVGPSLPSVASCSSTTTDFRSRYGPTPMVSPALVPTPSGRPPGGASPPPGNSIVLGPDGLGAATVGDPQAEAVAAVSAALGPPTATVPGDCQGTAEVEWKDLSLEFFGEALQGYRYREGGLSSGSPTPVPTEPGMPLLKTAAGATLGMTLAELRPLYPAKDFATEQGGAIRVAGAISGDRLLLGFFDGSPSTPLTEIKGGATCGDF